MYKQPVYRYVVFDRYGKALGVIRGFKKTMQYIHDNQEKGYTCKEFVVDELLNQ